MPLNPPTGSYYHVKVNSGKYKEYRVITIDKKKGIKAIIGLYKKGGETKSVVSTYMFLKTKWTIKKAKEWVKKRGNSNANFHYEEYLVKAEILSEEEVSDEALAKAGLKKNPDLMYTSFKLCHANTNSNQDEFEFDELKLTYGTAKLKPLDWEHSDEIIGTIYDSELVEDPDESDDEFPYIRAHAVVYKSKFPERASEMVKRHEEDKLFYSMEVWFETAVCSECGGEFSSSADYCDHLKNRFETKATSRKLRGITFGGAGVVTLPADTGATSLSVAKRITELNNKVDYDMTQTSKADENKSSAWVDWEKTDVMKVDLETLLEKDEAEEKRNRAMWIYQDAVRVLFNDSNLDEEEKVKKFNELSAQLLKIYEFKTTIDNSGGNIKMADKLYKTFETEEDYKNAITQSKVVSDLKSEIANVKKEVETLKASADTFKVEKEKIEKEFNEYKNGIEKEKLIASRVDVLKKRNVPEEKITDKLKETVAKLDEEEFKSFVDVLVEDKKDDDNKNANASTANKDQNTITNPGDNDDNNSNSAKASNDNKNFSLYDFLNKALSKE